MSAAIFCYPYTYALDHLAPIADASSMPLIVFDQDMKMLASKFCPNLLCKYEDDFEGSLFSYFKNYEVIFHTMLSWSHHALKLRSLFQCKDTRIIYVPHGNSDKRMGMHDNHLHHDIFLYYGQHMWDLLFEKENKRNIQTLIPIGNPRVSYYETNKIFLDKLFIESFGKYLDQSKKTVLFAPTWNDKEKDFTFFQEAKKLSDELRGKYNFLIKAHPAIREEYPAEYLVLESYCQKNATVFVEDFPFTYPLLNFVDIFISDSRSSIGYDFLYFNRPLYLLNNPLSDSLLNQCSLLIPSTAHYGDFIDANLKHNLTLFSEKRQKIYTYAFAPLKKISIKNILKQKERAYNSFYQSH